MISDNEYMRLLFGIMPKFIVTGFDAVPRNVKSNSAVICPFVIASPPIASVK